MFVRLSRGSVAFGFVVLSACATQTGDGPTEGGAAGASGTGVAGGSAAGSANAGAPASNAGASNSMAGNSASSGAPSSGGGGASSAGAAGKGAGGTGSAGMAAGGAPAGGAPAGGAPAGGAPAGGAPAGGAMGTAGAVGTCTEATVTVPGVFDAEINAAAPTTNVAYVAEAHIVRGGTNGSHRAVFWVDLGTVPKNKTLKSAKLQLTVANNPAGSKTLALHRINQGSNRKWEETQVTWQAFKTGSNWSTAGGDFQTTASDSKQVADNTPAGTVLEFNVLADAQSFYSTPATNYGWILKDSLDATSASGENVYISTREIATSAAPKLVIVYCQ